MVGRDADADETDAAGTALSDRDATLVESLLAGSHRALARVISRIEDRAPGYRAIVSALHDHTGSADVIGVTGSPGAGKSTLVDKLALALRDRGDTVGVVAVDPASPYTGGAVLGDRIRMASTVGDMDVFVRSMSARGQLGGLSMATGDAVTALDAFGKDVILIETVGAGQSEIDVVRTADTVAVLVQPGAGDDVQTLKAGILEIGDVFVVNKFDREGAERTRAELEAMVHRRDERTESSHPTGHHGPGAGRAAGAADDGYGATDPTDDGHRADDGDEAGSSTWTPPVVGTVAETGEGVDALLEAFDAHATALRDSGELASTRRRRHAAAIRTLIRADVGALANDAIAGHGGVDALAARVRRGETDPYTVAAEVVDPIERCVERAIDGEPSGSPGPDADPGADRPSEKD